LPMLVKKIPRTCAWVRENPGSRCAIRNVRDHCPSTCNGNCAADSNRRFQVGNGRNRNCRWVRRNLNRCRISGVKETCRATCA
jgi:hypothetical protein